MSRKTSRFLLVPVAAASGVGLPDNPRRVALLLGAHDAQNYHVAFGEVAVMSSGIGIPQRTDTLILTADLIGETITKEVRFIANVPIDVPVVEVVES